MLEFIKEALDGYAECHEAILSNDGLYVLVDLGDGEGLKRFYVTATMARNQPD